PVISPLPLHDALPIWVELRRVERGVAAAPRAEDLGELAAVHERLQRRLDRLGELGVLLRDDDALRRAVEHVAELLELAAGLLDRVAADGRLRVEDLRLAARAGRRGVGLRVVLEDVDLLLAGVGRSEE